MEVPGIPQEELVLLTRQQRWKLRQHAQGVCVSCAKAEKCPQSRTLCAACLKIQRERMRQRTSAGRRNLRSKSYDVDKIVAKFSAPPKRRGKKVKGKVTRSAKFRAEAKGKTRAPRANESLD